jgi:hypothetical protein
MAPKSLIKTLKYKPQTQLNMDDVPVVHDSGDLPQFVQNEAPVFPPPTPEELATWSAARALQTSLPNGHPTEGWSTRITTMKLDGRLMEHNGVWYRR